MARVMILIAIGNSLLCIVIQFGLVNASPNATQNVPHKCSVMGFIGVTTKMFEVVPYCAVDVAVCWNAFLPVMFTIFLGTFFKVFGDFEEHCRDTL